MSKQTIAYIIAGLILLTGIGFYFYSKKTPVALMGSKDSSILLYVESGDVSYKEEGGSFQKATNSPTEINNNTQVFTGRGQASILFPNNSSVSLDEYTELTVHYAEKKVSLYQTLGTTYHRVEALVTGATYEVATPGTVASVRGTKFAVKYDKNKKSTKVTVTEHKVYVAKVEENQNSTSTPREIESTVVEEGKTARVEAFATTTSQGSTSITTVETSADPDMSAWIEKNKTQDDFEKTLKEGQKSKEEIRLEIKSLLNGEKNTPDTTSPDQEGAKDPTPVKENKENKEVSSNKAEDKTTSQPKTETRTENKVETKAEQKTETKTTTSSNTSTGTSVPKKIDSDTFFDKFNTLFINYFYLDEDDGACKIKVAPAERLRVVATYASESGYPFQSKSLLDFAQAIDTYCANKDTATKVRLQGRFDIEFPFQEDL